MTWSLQSLRHTYSFITYVYIYICMAGSKKKLYGVPREFGVEYGVGYVIFTPTSSILLLSQRLSSRLDKFTLWFYTPAGRSARFKTVFTCK